MNLMIYTLYFPLLGAKFALFFISRISSTPLLEAASISIISRKFLLSICLQLLHSLHGSTPFNFSQLTILANILAILVLPVPLGPQNKYA